ncbi:MAG: response regulator, partial [Thermodesulfobacteriota bacterium]
KGDVNKEDLLFKIGEMLGISKPQRGSDNDLRKETGPPIGETLPTAKAGGISSVLIIEDNPDNLATIKAVLQNRFRILEAKDGEEGLRMASETRPDLILLDMAMPKMDGFTAIRHLKDHIHLKKIPVIAMTARAMKGDREKILEAGCDDYIAKPIDPEGFLKKIGEWVKG